jgi:DNA-binding NarL/FixJ family response regulator
VQTAAIAIKARVKTSAMRQAKARRRLFQARQCELAPLAPMVKNSFMKVLIADDHAIFRQGLRAVLDSLSESVAIEEAADVASALECAAGDPPDLVLLDLRMPGMDGFAGITALRRRLPLAPIVVLTASEESDDVFQALAAGANGYLAKSAPASVILDALRLVLVGGIYVPRELVAGAEIAVQPKPEPKPKPEAPRLTGRQNEVMNLIADGHSNKEIAHRLGTSEGTIKAHVTAIMRQLGVRNRVQMLLAAERTGLRSR